ncbi:hypothetical protein GMYAFLOJ_CDS0044 [Microbacterium phage phiMiGM15]
MTSAIIIRAAVAALPEATVRKLVDALIVLDEEAVEDELEALLTQEAAEATKAAESAPATVIDKDGDRWTLRPNGSYALRNDDDDDAWRDLANIRDAYGPIKTPDGVVIPA